MPRDWATSNRHRFAWGDPERFIEAVLECLESLSVANPHSPHALVENVEKNHVRGSSGLPDSGEYNMK